MAHPLVTTLAQLAALDSDEVMAGFMASEKGDPEPGDNHSLSFHHGWLSRQYDLGERPVPPEHKALTRAYAARLRNMT